MPAGVITPTSRTPRPLRILHVMARYWPAHGGAEGYLHEISKRLVAEGHEVTVATTDAAEVDTFGTRPVNGWQSSRRSKTASAFVVTPFGICPDRP